MNCESRAEQERERDVNARCIKSRRCRSDFLRCSFSLSTLSVSPSFLSSSTPFLLLRVFISCCLFRLKFLILLLLHLCLSTYLPVFLLLLPPLSLSPPTSHAPHSAYPPVLFIILLLCSSFRLLPPILLLLLSSMLVLPLILPAAST